MLDNCEPMRLMGVFVRDKYRTLAVQAVQDVEFKVICTVGLSRVLLRVG